MIRFIIAFILFLNVALGREDPFVSLVEPKDSVRPYYGETNVFDRKEITLPSNARLLKKIDITYQNIDGSIETKSVAVSGRVDWRMPIVVSQIFKDSQAIDNSKENSKSQDKEAKTAHINKNQSYHIEGKSIFIAYKGALIRDFIMKNPDRIVLDFEKNLKYYKNNPIPLKQNHFVSLKYGIHDTFLRIVLELDGSYVYHIIQKEDGVVINVE